MEHVGYVRLYVERVCVCVCTCVCVCVCVCMHICIIAHEHIIIHRTRSIHVCHRHAAVKDRPSAFRPTRQGVQPSARVNIRAGILKEI